MTAINNPDESNLGAQERLLRRIAAKAQRGGAHRPAVDNQGRIKPWSEQSAEYRDAHPHLDPARTDG